KNVAKRGLARARRADDGDELALTRLECHVVERPHLFTATPIDFRQRDRGDSVTIAAGGSIHASPLPARIATVGGTCAARHAGRKPAAQPSAMAQTTQTPTIHHCH